MKVSSAKIKTITRLNACNNRAPEYPLVQQIHWQRIHNENMGFHINLPTQFIQDPIPQQADLTQMTFRLQDYPILSISQFHAKQAGFNALLFPPNTHDRTDRLTALDNRPYGIAIHTLLIEHGGQYLALTFRSNHSHCNTLQWHIINSVELSPLNVHRTKLIH